MAERPLREQVEAILDQITQAVRSGLEAIDDGGEDLAERIRAASDIETVLRNAGTAITRSRAEKLVELQQRDALSLAKLGEAVNLTKQRVAAIVTKHKRRPDPGRRDADARP